MTSTAQNVLELARIVVNLADEVAELHRRLDAVDRRREGFDPEQLAGVVVARLTPQLDAAMRAARAGRRIPK